MHASQCLCSSSTSSCSWVIDFRYDNVDGMLASAFKSKQWMPSGKGNKKNLWDFYWLNWKDFGRWCPGSVGILSLSWL